MAPTSGLTDPKGSNRFLQEGGQQQQQQQQQQACRVLSARHPSAALKGHMCFAARCAMHTPAAAHTHCPALSLGLAHFFLFHTIISPSRMQGPRVCCMMTLFITLHAIGR